MNKDRQATMVSDTTVQATSKRWVWWVVVVLATVAVLPGCYHSDDVKAFLMKDHGPVSGIEYRVYPPDSIRIESLNVPEINGKVHRVRPDGKINLQLLGEFFVAGKTPSEIEKMLAEASKEYYEKTDATVQVVGYLSQNFYIFGQVSRPGPMPWTAIRSAGDSKAGFPVRYSMRAWERDASPSLTTISLWA